jgi:hypothetical protein
MLSPAYTWYPSVIMGYSVGIFLKTFFLSTFASRLHPRYGINPHQKNQGYFPLILLQSG